MRLLREERRMSRGQAILWGVNRRSASYGILRSLGKTASILAVDTFRAIVLTSLKISLLYPLRLAGWLVSKTTGKKVLSTAE